MKRLGVALLLILLTAGFAFAAPKTAAEYFAMGAQLYSAKDYQGAAYAYEAGLELDPKNAGGYQGLGDAYYFLGRQADAMIAYQKSLALDPKNLKLMEFVKTFKPQDSTGDETETTMFSKMQATPVIDYSTVNSQASTISSKPEVKFATGKSTWVRFYGGYDFALLSDLNNGINAWTPLLDSGSNTVAASTGSNGFRAGAEFGMLLDRGNGLSISCENVWTQTESYNNGVTQNGGNNGVTLAPQSASFQPSMMDISLNYYAYLPGGKGSRTYFTVGGGYYQATVGFVGVDPTLANPNENGTFTGSAFGWAFGFGETLAIGNSFGLEFSARGRIVSFSQMTSNTVNNTTQPDGGTGYAIVISTTSTSTTGVGTINVAPVSSITTTTSSTGTTSTTGNSPYRYAVLDYTGVDADLSFNFYF
jgi:hypothetical protein